MSGFVEQLSQMRKYQGQLTTQQLASSLSDLQELDKTSEQKKAKGCMVAAGGIAVAFLGGIGSLAIEQGILAGICAVIGIGLAIKGFITRVTVSYTHLRSPRDATLSRMPSSA